MFPVSCLNQTHSLSTCPLHMMILLPARFQAWLNKWARNIYSLLANFGLSWKSAQIKNDLLDLTEQISKESSRYPVAQGSFGDVWKCIRKHPRITVAVKCLRLEIPNDNCKTKITEVGMAPRTSNTTCLFANA